MVNKSDTSHQPQRYNSASDVMLCHCVACYCQPQPQAELVMATEGEVHGVSS